MLLRPQEQSHEQITVREGNAADSVRAAHDRVNTWTRTCDFELDTNIHFLALSDPGVVSTGVLSLGLPGPLLPRCIQRPFTLWSFATSRLSNWKLGADPFLSWFPQPLRSFHLFRILFHIPLSATQNQQLLETLGSVWLPPGEPHLPPIFFKRWITFPIKFSVRAPHIISSVWLRFFGNTKARGSNLFFTFRPITVS